jgi:hypothetical protein
LERWAIIIVDDEEENIKPKEEAPLEDEGIRDELKEETRVVQDIEQWDEDEDIEEGDNPEGWSLIWIINSRKRRKFQVNTMKNRH